MDFNTGKGDFNFPTTQCQTVFPSHQHFADAQPDPLSQINLRQLRLKNKQTEQTIKVHHVQQAKQSIQTKIIYMKNKQQKTVKRVLNIKRKLTSLENVRSKTNSIKIKYQQVNVTQQKEKLKQDQQLIKKIQFNKLIKDHLKHNKKIVNTLMTHKINDEINSFKTKNNKLSILTEIQRENLREENVQKANKVRMENIEAHERRKLYFLQKLNQFKQIKQQKLKQEIRERERQQQMISELQQRQKMLLQKLSASQRFRIKCQVQYQEARRKYKSFHDLSRGLMRGNHSKEQSMGNEQNNEGKAEIFIS